MKVHFGIVSTRASQLDYIYVWSQWQKGTLMYILYIKRQESRYIINVLFIFVIWSVVAFGTHRFPLVHLQLVYDSGRYRN